MFKEIRMKNPHLVPVPPVEHQEEEADVVYVVPPAADEDPAE